MLDIIWLIYLCMKNSENAQLRGRKPGKYIALTIMLWLGFEIDEKKNPQIAIASWALQTFTY